MDQNFEQKPEIPGSVGERVRLATVLGLPDHVRACLFDLDGVLTETASIHDAAWKKTFDAYLEQRSARTGEVFSPFDPANDYATYVDGKPRADGVRSFLASRGISLREGSPNDPPDSETINGLGNRKNRELLHRIAQGGVSPFDGSVKYLEAVTQQGLGTAVVSSSANCREIIEAAHLSQFFHVRVDGITIRREHLQGKPAPDSFLAAARILGVEPKQAAIFEDALAGVEAGRAGKFGWVVGVDRVGQAHELREHGADVVVTDLAQLLDKD